MMLVNLFQCSVIWFMKNLCLTVKKWLKSFLNLNMKCSLTKLCWLPLVLLFSCGLKVRIRPLYQFIFSRFNPLYNVKILAHFFLLNIGFYVNSIISNNLLYVIMNLKYIYQFKNFKFQFYFKWKISINFFKLNYFKLFF